MGVSVGFLPLFLIYLAILQVVTVVGQEKSDVPPENNLGTLPAGTCWYLVMCLTKQLVIKVLFVQIRSTIAINRRCISMGAKRLLGG